MHFLCNSLIINGHYFCLFLVILGQKVDFGQKWVIWDFGAIHIKYIKERVRAREEGGKKGREMMIIFRDWTDIGLKTDRHWTDNGAKNTKKYT